MDSEPVMELLVRILFQPEPQLRNLRLVTTMEVVAQTDLSVMTLGEALELVLAQQLFVVIQPKRQHQNL